MKDTKLYVVIPCYNEEEVLSETSGRMLELFKSMISDGLIGAESRIVMVDDGSRDSTWEIISRLSESSSVFRGIKLAHNAGHQNAVLAGLMTVKDECDCAVSIDADLQDDINAIAEMVRKYDDGCDVVYGVRSERKTDTFFKRFTAEGFYKFMKIMGVEIVFNHADYRLMSRRALDSLSEFKEVNLFLRGIVPQIGFKSDCVYYQRAERFAGESKYPLKKMLSFAFDGITSFSVKPIKLVWSMGVFVCIAAIIAAVYTLISKFFGYTSDGWASIMCSIWFIGGVQLISVGVIGEYIGKIYKETKARPRFIIEEYKKQD
ncbi:MAG TPA: glycosyltransferase family 2 protein [Candidatus Monoglobus merdigallinarum]|uniref:Glycosyltransferase family 2 protein n=1 Tax=Candidatus Monoglobus merdigallinarum TaxID=2838698 RepID=A0A9D1PQT5_9FIRM|nr:glycosyltransferase family 2 protein [Candidatus Monoglobus merdigallinarum]